MSRIAELIAKLCPNGIEYVKLEDVCTLVTGATPSKTNPEYWENGTVPWMSSGEVNNKVVYDTESKITQLGYDKTSTTLVPIHTVVIALAGQGKTRGKVAITEIELCTNQSLCSIICGDKINYKFLYHYLDSKYEELREISNGDGTRGGLSLRILKPYTIPLPPLEIQIELVRILDEYSASVTALQQELEKELTARKKQYEYYRDLLLDFGVHEGATSECKRRTIKLGDIGKISMCKRIMKSETSPDGDIPFYKIGTFGGEPNAYISKETFEKYKSLYSFPKKGDILISAAGTIGRTVVYDGEPAYYQDSNIVWIDNDETIVLNRYLYYVYQLSPWQISTGGTIARLYNDNIANAKINIPSIKEQERIVSILDRFDKLCNDISEGLPAEIEARRKQYVYYRDKLLSFNEA